MQRQSGKDMIVFGSGFLVSQLTQHGLIDEYQFVVCPVLLGDGQPLPSGVSKNACGSIYWRPSHYPSGGVMLRYARPR